MNSDLPEQYQTWPDAQFVQQAAVQLPWGHHLAGLGGLRPRIT